METICLKCLEKEPTRRYGTAQLLAEQLERFLEGKPVLATPVSRMAKTCRWCRRNLALASLIAGLVAALALGENARLMQLWSLPNAIGLAAFRRNISLEEAETAQALLEADFAAGHLEQVDLLWRGALNRAAELSRIHTPKLGTRSLDVLHVACALELKLRHFVTFDNRQRQLARAAGLRIVVL